jgi:uncharacterized membrane protein
MHKKSRELLDEFRVLLAGRNSFLDAILPPVVFLLLNSFVSFQAAMWGALILSIIFAAVRLLNKQSLSYALGGVGSVLLAMAVVWIFGKSEGFFIPGLVSGGVTLLITIISLIIRRPMMAWTSYIARRWPLNWYWHPQVRPAYSEVTLAWGLFFAAKFLLQYSLFQDANTDMLAMSTLITGWPATTLLLIVSYLYGTWRLVNLAGPSVDEFQNNIPAPWTSQRRGF